MIWKKGKHAKAFMIGYDGETQNGYKIARTHDRYIVYFAASFRGQHIKRDSSLQIVKQACKEHQAMQLREREGAESTVLRNVSGGV